MRILFVLSAALLQLSVSGCMTPPKTADEFRHNVSAFFIPHMEKFEADRSFKSVTETFRKLVPKCLHKTIQSSSPYAPVFNNWNPSFNVTEKKAELHLRRYAEKKVMQMSDDPQKGDFVLVADITPVNADKTGVVIYLSSAKGVDDIAKALEAWARGTSTACPDLTKI